MNKEDYFKYYIQGSDHYLIPKDVFKELFNEMMNWKEETKGLKIQLEDTNEELELVRCDLHNRTSERNEYYRNIEILENQQKEFIEYMNKTIEELECEDVDDEEMKGYLIQRIDTFKQVKKQKEIIDKAMFDNFLKSVPTMVVDDKDRKTISAYGSIDVNDLRSAIDTFKKVPEHGELLKQVKKQKEVIDKAIEYILKETKSMPVNGCTIRLKELLDILKEVE